MTTATEIKNDDWSVGYFKEQLVELEQTLEKEEYEQLYWANGTLIPREDWNKPWLEETGYRKVTGIGRWEAARDYTTHVPNVEIVSKEFRQRVSEHIGGYSVNDKELELSQHFGTSIDSEKVQIVLEAGQQYLDKMVFSGDGQLRGFFNHPDTLKSYSAYAFNSSATVAQMLAVLNDTGNAMRRLTRNIETPDTILFAQSTHDEISFRRLSDFNSDSVLDYYLSKATYIKDVMPLLPLEDVGDSGSDVACYYKRDPNKIKFRITEPFSFKKWIELPRGMQRTARMKYGGLIIKRPYSVLWLHGL